MKSFFAKVWEWIKKAFVWIFSSWKNLALVALLIAAIILYFNYKTVNGRYQNVIRQHTDTVTVYKNKIGELYAQNTAYITDIKTLKESNAILYEEAKNLKENPIVVTKYKTVTEYKDIIVKDTVFVNKEDSTLSMNIDYEDDWTLIKGSSMMDLTSMTGETRIDSILFINNFTLDLIESKKGDLSFIVKSDNPHCQINSLTGVMLSPEDSKAIKKRYNKPWCVVVGIGPAFTVVNSKFVVRPALQITLGYKLFSF